MKNECSRYANNLTDDQRETIVLFFLDMGTKVNRKNGNWSMLC